MYEQGVRRDEAFMAHKRYGYLEKLSFCPGAALRVKILSSQYQIYACTKNFTRTLILNQNPNFARYPYCLVGPTPLASRLGYHSS